MEQWRKLCNEARQRTSPGKMTPDAFARMIGKNENQGATLEN